jgi:hypothetical protein
MEATLRFKVSAPEGMDAQAQETIVTIKVEVASLEEELQDLILMHTATDIHKYQPPPEQRFSAETIPFNRWSEEPMDICHGEWTEGGITARGAWKDVDTFVPDFITAKEASLEGLVNAIVEDEATLYGEDGMTPEMLELENEMLHESEEDPDEGEEWKKR